MDLDKLISELRETQRQVRNSLERIEQAREAIDQSWDTLQNCYENVQLVTLIVTRLKEEEQRKEFKAVVDARELQNRTVSPAVDF